jgi:DNA-binding response OmpR family regulator
MSNERAILIVDSNEGFATMLKQSLEQEGEYRATVTTSGNQALQTLSNGKFDLAIVDLGLNDSDGVTFARTLRQQEANLRLVLIPLQGDELPSELSDLDVQGVLPKPFFLPELPERITEALTRPMGQTAAAVESPDNTEAEEPAATSNQPGPSGTERLDMARAHIPGIIQEMARLAREVNAAAVLLSCKGRLISHTGQLSAEKAVELAQAVAESWRTAAHVAQILGQEMHRFEQSTEGGEHMLYSLAVAEDIILSVALRANVPLGMIRHQAKETADTLQALIGITA